MSQRILIIGPAWVGDMVMAQSLFKLLKHIDPQVMIDVLAPEWTFSLLSRMPEVSNAIPLPITHGEFKLVARYRIAKHLRESHYDQAIVLQNSFKSALIPWFAHIPKRTGWLRECRGLLLNDGRRLDKKRYPLMIEQYMALGLPPDKPMPETQPFYPELSVTNAAQVLSKHQLNVGQQPLLALCAGSEFGPSKRWLPEYYAEVANQKLTEGWAVWLFGSAKDRPITDQIMALTQDRCVNLAGQLALAESIDLLSLVSGLVTNDSGLMHVGAALKKPVIAIYGSTSPSFTPPLSETAQVLKLQLDCQPCFKRVCPLKHHRCMRDLQPAQVLSAMKRWSTS